MIINEVYTSYCERGKMVLETERERSNDDGRDQPFDFSKTAFPKAVKATSMITCCD